jgi:hypothetical protein
MNFDEGEQPTENPLVQTTLVASVKATKMNIVSGRRLARAASPVVADLTDTNIDQTPIPVRKNEYVTSESSRGPTDQYWLSRVIPEL